MSDILSGLFAPPPEGPAQPMTYRQGVVRAFNQTTLANQVEVGGTIMNDLPLLGVGEAELITVGSVVGVMCVDKTWAIIGRLVYPNTAEATSAMSLLSARTQAQIILTQQGTAVTTYGNLGTYGPSVTLTVRSSGRVLVLMGCWMQWLATVTTGGDMGLNMSGANTLVPTSGDDSVRAWQSLSGAIQHAGQWSPFGARVYEGLTPGQTTFWCTYKSVSGASVDFSRRVLVVQAL